VQSTSRAPDWTPVASAAATAVAAPILAYAEFAAAVKNALRDANRPDLLARNLCCATESAITAGRSGRKS
jgi:hypothetical protein